MLSPDTTSPRCRGSVGPGSIQSITLRNLGALWGSAVRGHVVGGGLDSLEVAALQTRQQVKQVIGYARDKPS